MIKSTITFVVNNTTRHTYEIEHNMPETPGLSIYDAVISWSARTSTYSAKSLRYYIRSKDSSIIFKIKSELKTRYKDEV
jgi:hypothetical protein